MDVDQEKDEEFKEQENMSTLLYEKFELPNNILCETDPNRENTAKFIAEPLERGFGHTLGNSIRRMLLTAIETPAIMSVIIEGVPHEYCGIEGVIEDVTNIVLNLKGALLRKHSQQLEGSRGREQKILTTEIEVTQADLGEKGQKIVTLKELIRSGEFEIINPDLAIFTVTKPLKKRFSLRIGIGKGYVSAERHEIKDPLVDEIIIDSIFSPVRLVNYHVEDTRVGQDTDFDRLVIEVQTDGRITPKEAISFSSKILKMHLDVFDEMKETQIEFDTEDRTTLDDEDEIMKKLILGINEIELSVRSTNCLSWANIATIGELVVMPEPELLQFRNFGKKSLNEIKAKLYEMGLSLGMDLSRYGLSQENIKERINLYLEAREKSNET